MTKPARKLEPIPMAPPRPANDDRLLRDVEVAEMLGVKPVTMRAWRTRGDGPPFVVLGKRSPRYRRADVLAYIESRLRLVNE